MFTDAEIRSIARWCCGIYAIPLRDLEDVEQEIRIGMWQAEARFDASKSRKGLASYLRQSGIIRARRWKRDRVPMIHLPGYQMDRYGRQPLRVSLECEFGDGDGFDKRLESLAERAGGAGIWSCLHPSLLW